MIAILGSNSVTSVRWKIVGEYRELVLKLTTNFLDILNEPFISVLSTLFKNISGSCPKEITVESSGGSKIWKSQLGIYNLIRYDSSGNAVYEHLFNKGMFLYKLKDVENIWMVITF